MNWLLSTALVAPALFSADPIPTAIKEVSIIDVADGKTLVGWTIVIDKGEIAAMGKPGEVAVPPGSLVVSGEGKLLIPGLWDMHVHIAHADYCLSSRRR